MDFTLTPESLTMLAGAVLSLLFSYVPGLSDWYGALEATYKRLIMAGLLLVTTGAVFGLACAGILSGIACDQPGLINVVWTFILAIVANQSVYSITKRETAKVILPTLHEYGPEE